MPLSLVACFVYSMQRWFTLAFRHADCLHIDLNSFILEVEPHRWRR
jgi:hypothetical protein